MQTWLLHRLRTACSLTTTLQLGNALPKYIGCGKLVAVVTSTALRTRPMAVSESEFFVDIPTSAGLARREESVDFVYGDTVLPCNILQFVYKFCMCQIRHLPSPKLRHTCEAKVFDEDAVVLTAKSVCKLPLPSIALIDNAFIYPVQFLATLLSMIGVLLAHGELATLLLE